jgi:hypothetical protein
MTEPVVIEPQMQKDIWDCGVACLAMLLGRSYQEVRACIRFKAPAGMSVYEIRRVAKTLGHPLVFSKIVDHEDIGILILEREDDAHVVLFAKGTLYNPAQGEWWTDVDSYLKRSNYRIVGLLQRRD